MPAAPTIAAIIPTMDGMLDGGMPRFRRKTGVKAVICPQNTVSRKLAAVYRAKSHTHDARSECFKRIVFLWQPTCSA